MTFGNAESETARVEAFSDGVLAVIITIMALELRAPVGGSFNDLRGRLPALLVYILSFVFIGIYSAGNQRPSPGPQLRARTPMSLGRAMRQHV